MVQIGFNPQEYEIPSVGDPLPQGWYEFVVEKIEVRANKANTGSYLEVTLAVDENHHPDFAGRKAWDRLNVFHQQEKTAKIARGRYRQLQESAGKPLSQETDDLIGSRVLAKLKVRAATEQYPASNDVDGYKPSGSAPVTQAPAAGAPASAQAPAAPATPAAVPAWVRR
jgi:hypothetical protein